MPNASSIHNNGNVVGYYYQDTVNTALGHTVSNSYDYLNRLTSSVATPSQTGGAAYPPWQDLLLRALRQHDVHDQLLDQWPVSQRDVQHGDHKSSDEWRVTSDESSFRFGTPQPYGFPVPCSLSPVPCSLDEWRVTSACPPKGGLYERCR